MSAIDDYMVVPGISLLDKVRIQAQVLVPIMRALRAELGRDKADAIVRDALRDWSRKLFAAIRRSCGAHRPARFATSSRRARSQLGSCTHLLLVTSSS
jgi:hypothetical protein